jgi:hypothetical protein
MYTQLFEKLLNSQGFVLNNYRPTNFVYPLL